MALSDQIIGAESGGDANAKNPNSSAGGAGQFIDGTWVSMLRQHRPDLAQGKSDADLVALKTNGDLSKQMVDAYAADNGQILAKNGLPVTPGSTYLAHFAGPQGAVSVLKADPTAPVSSVLSPEAVKSNPFLQKMTVADLTAWADRKMGNTAPAGGSPPARAQPSAPQGILNQVAQPGAGGNPAGILNGAGDDGAAAFRDRLANMATQQQQAPSIPALQQLQMAMPRGLPRAKLLAALSQPLGA